LKYWLKEGAESDDLAPFQFNGNVLYAKLLFFGVFAQSNAPKVLRSFFKSDLLRSQAHRRFSFGNFSFCAFLVKKKSGVPIWVLKPL
jgi:hypothetical protein